MYKLNLQLSHDHFSQALEIFQSAWGTQPGKPITDLLEQLELPYTLGETELSIQGDFEGLTNGQLSLIKQIESLWSEGSGYTHHPEDDQPTQRYFVIQEGVFMEFIPTEQRQTLQEWLYTYYRNQCQYLGTESGSYEAVARYIQACGIANMPMARVGDRLIIWICNEALERLEAPTAIERLLRHRHKQPSDQQTPPES